MNVPPPLAAPLISRLNELVGEENVLTTAADLQMYAFDGSAAVRRLPGTVVLAKSTRHVSETMRLAREFQVPVVARGSGTGLSGGSVPVRPCIVLCVNAMNQILEVDHENLTLLAEPGVITLDIDRAAATVGLFYPPDPGSQKISTIGGNVAENSGGLRGLKYGVTRNYVMGLEVVLPDGQIAWLGNKCVKDVAGYSLRDLFIGSEGTLGIVTKVLLRLIPRPAARQTLLATYDDMRAAAATVSAIIAAPIIPCTLEFLDHQTINCVEDFANVGLPRDAAAVLLMESDGHPLVVEAEAEAMREFAIANGARDVRVAANEQERDSLLTARRSAFSALARARPTTLMEDITVPRSHLPEMVATIAEVAARENVRIGTFGHMGDGNLHPTFLSDERDSEEMHRVEVALDQIVAKAIELKGTVTGEHGIGTTKMKYLPLQFDTASFDLLKKIKHALDPENLLNPGKIFAEPDICGDRDGLTR